ncbi:MAG: hypothetical protein RDU14_12525 [Melioribacteraceae bacterium]|jgi:hypothetical protein|nr:hypothetical protein [Melioribacteraceae bacterium]
MKRLLFIVFVLLLHSCSAVVKSIYDFDYPLKSETAYSNNSNISVKIPEGWFTAVDNECNCIDLWLIKDDYTQSLNFTLINLDEVTRNEVKTSGIKRVADYCKIFVRVKLGNSFKGFSGEESFELNGNLFFAYQYLDKDDKPVRVVVFEHQKRFYELTAISKESGNFEQLFSIQNSVLTSMD